MAMKIKVSVKQPDLSEPDAKIFELIQKTDNVFRYEEGVWAKKRPGQRLESIHNIRRTLFELILAFEQGGDLMHYKVVAIFCSCNFTFIHSNVCFLRRFNETVERLRELERSEFLVSEAFIAMLGIVLSWPIEDIIAKANKVYGGNIDMNCREVISKMNLDIQAWPIRTKYNDFESSTKEEFIRKLGGMEKEVRIGDVKIAPRLEIEWDEDSGRIVEMVRCIFKK